MIGLQVCLYSYSHTFETIRAIRELIPMTFIELDHVIGSAGKISHFSKLKVGYFDIAKEYYTRPCTNLCLLFL